VYSDLGQPVRSRSITASQPPHRADAVIGLGGGRARYRQSHRAVAVHPGDVLECAWDHPCAPSSASCPARRARRPRDRVEVGRFRASSPTTTHIKEIIFRRSCS
jgi:hypothetical protein